MWVKSEYAGEVAVLSTWVCALLPWSVSLFQRDLGSAGTLSAVWIRFLPGRFLYVFGPVRRAQSPWDWAWEVPGFVATRGEALAGYVWLAGVALSLVALALSVVYYLDEDRVEAWEPERLPREFDPVEALGALLVATGGALLVASGLLVWYQSGVTVPVGALLQLALGGLLLRVERA